MRYILILFLINLFIRLPLINLNTAEYTDAIEFIMGNSPNVNRLPLYPFLIRTLGYICKDLETAGKLVSIIFGSFTVIPVYLISIRLCNRKTAIYASLLYTTSAPIMRWSIRVMSEALFGFLITATFFFIIEYYYTRKKMHLFLMLFIGGLATLTRPEGRLILLPIITVMVISIINSEYKISVNSIFHNLHSKLTYILSLILGLIPLVIFIIWSANNDTKISYENFFKLFLSELTLSRFFNSFINNFKLFVYSLTYPVFILLIIGLIYKNKDSSNITDRIKYFKFGYLIYVLLWFIIISIYVHWSWSDRFFYQIIPLSFIIAGYGIANIGQSKGFKLSTIIISFCLLLNILLSVLSLYYQRDAFGDIKRSAIFIRENLKDETVFSDEILKTSFWSGNRIEAYKFSEIYQGQYIVLHSFYSNISNEIKRISKKYKVNIIYENESNIVHIFPDIPDYILEGVLPPVLLPNIKRGNFKSVIIRIE